MVRSPNIDSKNSILDEIVKAVRKEIPARGYGWGELLSNNLTMKNGIPTINVGSGFNAKHYDCSTVALKARELLCERGIEVSIKKGTDCYELFSRHIYLQTSEGTVIDFVPIYPLHWCKASKRQNRANIRKRN